MSRDVDVVVVDTPPLGEVSDALRIAAQADEILIVARPDHTSLAGFERTRDLLERSGHPASGIVVVGGQIGATSGYPYGTGGTVEGSSGITIAPDERGSSARLVVAPQAQTVVAALVAGTTVGVLVASQPLVAAGVVLAPLAAALALYRLPLAVALWIPLMFVEGVPGSRLAPGVVRAVCGCRMGGRPEGRVSTRRARWRAWTSIGAVRDADVVCVLARMGL